jgi:hypothetical protein
VTQSAAGSDISNRLMRQSPSRVTPNRLDGTIDFLGTLMSFPGNAEIYGEGESVDYFYKVLSGTAEIEVLLIEDEFCSHVLVDQSRGPGCVRLRPVRIGPLKNCASS